MNKYREKLRAQGKLKPLQIMTSAGTISAKPAPTPAAPTAPAVQKAAPVAKLTGFALAQSAFSKTSAPTSTPKVTQPRELTGLARAHAAFNKQQSTK
jgi:hypothetical protein